VNVLAVAGDAARLVGPALTADAATGGLTINLFWIIVSALNFIVFLVLIWTFAFKPISGMLADRRTRIEEGLRNAEQARRDRDQAEAERVAALAEARREANDILNRAQKVAQETRDADIAATRAELERLRQRAAEDIQAEKGRAMADLRAEVASLALEAAAKVVGESMDDARQRRLVDEFLRETATPPSGASS
jgi:F-type H+-transporting ATPase subunit b